MATKHAKKDAKSGPKAEGLKLQLDWKVNFRKSIEIAKPAKE
jgi:hypothetical protein